MHRKNTEENSLDDYLPTPDDFELDNPIEPRSSSDSNEISGHGKDLNNFCRTSGFRIVNGRPGDDRKVGNFTCHTRAGSSLVDYCLVSQRNFDLIKYFLVGKLNTLSDHAYLHLSLKTNNITRGNDENNEKGYPGEKLEENIANPADSNLETLRKEYNCRYVTNEKSREEIVNCLNSTEFRHELEYLTSQITSDDISVDEIIGKLQKSMY